MTQYRISQKGEVLAKTESLSEASNYAWQHIRDGEVKIEEREKGQRWRLFGTVSLRALQ